MPLPTRQPPRASTRRADRRPRPALWHGALLAAVLAGLAGLVAVPGPASRAATDDPGGAEALERGRHLLARPAAEVEAASRGCLACHAGVEPAHASPAVRLACVDCHGGDAAPEPPTGTAPGDEGYEEAKRRAHVRPRFPERWPDGAANPVRAYTLTLEESAEYVRFVNPGDLRVAPETCGPCHPDQVDAVAKSPMTTSAIFWAAAGYANGILDRKGALFGESYGRDGGARAVRRPPTPSEAARGAVPQLLPLPRWELTPPGEYFRAFERGGLLNPSKFPEIGNPNPLAVPGRPDIRLSDRGPGTGLRISPALINLHKTRLNDPHLSMLGTNDHPGDYRSSGCSACHLVYANDREPLHSGPWAVFGHRGESASDDPTIARGEPGHPIRHRLTRAVPTSQCMSCHMHQPNAFLNTYLGYTMWDYETDGELLWPEEQRDPTPAERRASLEHNPEGAAARGLWTDVDFLARVSELNPRARHTRFADYHGHGWVFRAVFARDREGRLLDSEGEVVPFDSPDRFERAVHLADVHLERGMHCADCHFSRDVHGDGLLHGEYGNAIEIRCEDCHGTPEARATLRTSGPAAPPGGTDLAVGTVPDGRRRFVRRGSRILQRSMLHPGREWEVPQVADSLDPAHPGYNPAAARAKTVRRDGASWGDVLPADHPDLAHSPDRLTCYACHSSWMTSCFGCHLPQEANVRSAMNRYEGLVTRNYASYNPQVIRTDVFMLGIDGDVLGNRVAPVRSSSALVLSSTNADRQRFYLQQPPISSPGFASQAFNPHVPHTVRTRETKGCTDCHLSAEGDNEAWMAQLLTLGTGFVDFVGRFAWAAAGEHGFEAVAVTEPTEPQAVLGSYLHHLAYPRDHAGHEARGGRLETAYHHGPAGGEVVDLQLRGEYLYAAKGPGGFEVFDVANVDNKDFSERIVTAPVSPLGQDTAVPTRWAAAVALPSTMPMAFDREVDPANREGELAPLYRYAFVADREEGLILVDVATLTDGEPRNNFLERAVTFDAGGALRGARGLAVAGDRVYVAAGDSLAVVDVSTPLEPRLVATLGGFDEPRAVVARFRHAYVTDATGLTVVDVTRPEAPRRAARVELGASHGLHVARTWAYVAAGGRGLALVDVTRPEAPRLDRYVTADGRLSDVRDVTVGATNASLFAYVADAGEDTAGLHVLELLSPETTPAYLGFSPRPEPRWIAHYPSHHPVLAVSKGLERDRAADESGNQLAVFNRIGARPFDRGEMERLYLRDGEVYRVTDEPVGPVEAGEADEPVEPAEPGGSEDGDAGPGGRQERR